MWLLGPALGLFASVLLHELGHSLVALRYGYLIESITLWLLGVAQMTESPEGWRRALPIAGPAVSAVLSGSARSGYWRSSLRRSTITRCRRPRYRRRGTDRGQFEYGHTGFPVIDDGAVVGIVTLEDVRGVEPAERNSTLVRDVTSTDLTTIGPEGDILIAATILQGKRVGRILVTDESGGLIGLITRSDSVRTLRIETIRDRYGAPVSEPVPDDALDSESRYHRW